MGSAGSGDRSSRIDKDQKKPLKDKEGLRKAKEKLKRRKSVSVNSGGAMGTEGKITDTPIKRIKVENGTDTPAAKKKKKTFGQGGQMQQQQGQNQIGFKKKKKIVKKTSPMLPDSKDFLKCECRILVFNFFFRVPFCLFGLLLQCNSPK